MVKYLDTLLTVVLLGAAVVSAQQYKLECGQDVGKCPENKPCCFQYGQCGIGAYCLGGCDSKFSFEIESCVPAPVCQNKVSTFEKGIDSVASIYTYLGDATKYDWVAEGKAVPWNGNLLLTMPKDSVGTVVSSTHYVWYGKVTATLKTSRGKGVVSAFILFSGVKDEIDFEWVGVSLHNVQSNYYFQGNPIYTNGGNHTVEGASTYDEYHTYTIDWTPDAINWYVDGNLLRTKLKKDTWNDQKKIFEYPQTPSRIQLSLWPGGLATNGKGTIEWAGGLIDWDSQDIKEAGYYYVTVKELTMECYDPPSGAKIEGKKSYIYDNDSGLEDSVVISDKDYVLKSFLGSGTDMKKEPPKSTSISSGSSSKPTDVVETIPGNTGGGTSTHDIIVHDGNTDGGNTNGTTGGGYSNSTSYGTDKGANSTGGPFTQDTGSTASTFTSSVVATLIVIAGIFAA